MTGWFIFEGRFFGSYRGNHTLSSLRWCRFWNIISRDGRFVIIFLQTHGNPSIDAIFVVQIIIFPQARRVTTYLYFFVSHKVCHSRRKNNKVPHEGYLMLLCNSRLSFDYLATWRQGLARRRHWQQRREHMPPGEPAAVWNSYWNQAYRLHYLGRREMRNLVAPGRLVERGLMLWRHRLMLPVHLHSLRPLVLGWKLNRLRLLVRRMVVVEKGLGWMGSWVVIISMRTCRHAIARMTSVHRVMRVVHLQLSKSESLKKYEQLFGRSTWDNITCLSRHLSWVPWNYYISKMCRTRY